MQKKKRSLLAVVLLAILALLVFPGWNPFLDEGQKQAVVSQLQKSFGGLVRRRGLPYSLQDHQRRLSFGVYGAAVAFYLLAVRTVFQKGQAPQVHGWAVYQPD